jgi:predicted dehydrogenase
MKEKSTNQSSSRRKFIKLAGLGIGAGVLRFQQVQKVQQQGSKTQNKTQKVNQPILPKVEGSEMAPYDPKDYVGWVPVSDRKIKVGLVGYGACRMGALFEFQSHPNVEVVAVSDLFPDRCAQLAKETGCNKTYPSLEELVKDDSIEAVFVATDAPSHPQHCIDVLRHGKHVAVCIPAVYGSLEDADRLFEEVKKSGLKYMAFETSAYRADNHAMRTIYNAGMFGKIVYAEGEYFGGPGSEPDPLHPSKGVGSYKNWRVNGPPQWYPTHSNAYYICVTGGSFTEVSCMGFSRNPGQPVTGQYKNPFTSEIALFKTSEGGMARMGVSHETPGNGGETGRVRGIRGSYYGGEINGKYTGWDEKKLPDLTRPALPPGVNAGGHGRSHGRLMNEFVTAILQDRKPLVDIAMALNLTVSGVVAHQSALKDGELMKIPQYKMWTV